jgi:hypothetical protein
MGSQDLENVDSKYYGFGYTCHFFSYKLIRNGMNGL